MMLSPVIFILVIIQLLFVSILDIRTKKISNIWSIANIIIFIVLLLAMPESYKLQITTFIYPLGLLLVGFILYLIKIMGAGDAKYLFTLFLLIPVQCQNEILMFLLYTTITVGLVLLLMNIIKNFDIIYMSLITGDLDFIKRIFGKKFTYSPVIFVSWIWYGWKNFYEIFVF